jgi:glutamate-1-semialdehyde 2,1-aminomutase
MDSKQLFNEAKSLIPGGVNSPVRAFNAVGGQPIYLASGDGAYVTDVEGNRYLDFCGSWGPLILGHAHPEILKTVSETMVKGLTFGACHPLEVKMAQLVCEQVPAMEMVRMVNSGTEATMSAIRLARGATNRQLILKFDGCYHGHADYLLVASGSGLLTGGITTSAGVSEEMVNDVLVVAYNDIEAVRRVFAEKGEEIAAVIVEPVAGNMGLVPPLAGFLETLREETSKAGALLIFDEVISGFRLDATTYGQRVGIVPDLTCLGKIIGGGMPLAAFGGKKELMEQLAPLGAVYQAGTLSGNPVALAAGIKTIELLVSLNPYSEMKAKAERIADMVNSLGLAVICAQLGGMFTLFFTTAKSCPTHLDEVKECDESLFARYHQAMLQRGFYLSPSQYELGFVSAVHTDEDVDRFIVALREVLSDILN